MLGRALTFLTVNDVLLHCVYDTAAEQEEGHHLDNWKLGAMLHGDKTLAAWARTPQVVGVAIKKQDFSQVMPLHMLHGHELTNGNVGWLPVKKWISTSHFLHACEAINTKANASHAEVPSLTYLQM